MAGVAGWLLAAAPAEATLISEFLYDAPGSDNGFGFVELAGPVGQTLDGWALLVINGLEEQPFQCQLEQ